MAEFAQRFFGAVLFIVAAAFPASALRAQTPSAAARPTAATRPAPATAPLSPSELASLRRSARVGAAADVFAAIKKLAAAGDHATAASAIPALLARDLAGVKEESAGVMSALPRVRANEKSMAALRKTTIEGIKKLVHEPGAIKIARAHHDQLIALQKKLAIDYARQWRLVEAAKRRKVCLELWAQADPKAVLPTPNIAGPETERMTQMVEKAIGMPLADALAYESGPLAPQVTDPPPGEDDRLQRGLWFYISCRRIEAYNKGLESNMNPPEVAHGRILNAYREALGFLPYEIDVRLIQAARRHGREMIDLRYFSHWSPTDGLHSIEQRIRAAGYPRPSSENTDLGGWSGEDSFWFLFGSPDHHRDWIKPWETAFGVGKWENAWVECFGSGRRLMLMSDEQRARAAIKGELLKPQAAELTRKQPLDPRDFKFYDERGNEFVPEVFKRFPKPLPASGRNNP